MRDMLEPCDGDILFGNLSFKHIKSMGYLSLNHGDSKKRLIGIQCRDVGKVCSHGHVTFCIFP